MAAIFFLFLVSAWIQTISAQCIGNALAAEDLAIANNALAYVPGLSANGLPCGASYGAYGALAPGYINPASISGGGFSVTSTSPLLPLGISIISENAIEGALNVIGELPFLSAVVLEGALPTAGAGGINYGCGNGAVGISSGGVTTAYAPAAPLARLGLAGYGNVYGTGLAGSGLAGPGFGYNSRGGCGLVGIY